MKEKTTIQTEVEILHFNKQNNCISKIIERTNTAGYKVQTLEGVEEVPDILTVILEVSKVVVPLITSIFSAFTVKVPSFVKVEGTKYFMTVRYYQDHLLQTRCQCGYIDRKGSHLSLNEGLTLLIDAKTEKQARKAMKSLLKAYSLI